MSRKRARACGIARAHAGIDEHDAGGEGQHSGAELVGLEKEEVDDVRGPATTKYSVAVNSQYTGTAMAGSTRMMIRVQPEAGRTAGEGLGDVSITGSFKGEGVY